ncbi:MAG: hypothetical protein KR126chlam3_00098 [Chlamydiae bacterium]|nr:hypothetical protein [Chlamydiota bacterium]
MSKKFSIRIASDTSREKVFAEIYYDNDQWAEISQEKEKPVVIFFSPAKEKYWEFPLEEALATLEKAKEELLH